MWIKTQQTNKNAVLTGFNLLACQEGTGTHANGKKQRWLT